MLVYIKGRVLQIFLLFVAMCSTSLQSNDTSISPADAHPIATDAPTAVANNKTLAPDFSLQDVNGTEHTLSQYAGKYVVLEWVHFKCKAVDRLYRSGTMPEFQRRYADDGAIWLSIAAPATGRQGQVPVKQMRKLVEKRGSQQTAFLMDPDGRVGQLYGVEMIPHIALISPEGEVLYEGAFDNRPDPSEVGEDEYVNYIDLAIGQHKKGESITIPRAEPYGCNVKYSF